MHVKWLIKKIKTALKCSCFMLTFILVTRRILEKNDARQVPVEVSEPTGAFVKAFVRTAINDDAPFEVVFDAKPAQNAIKNDIKNDIKNQANIAKPANVTRRLTGLFRVLGFAYDIFLFSAVIGNSSSDKIWDTVVLQGWEHEMYENNSFGCCVKYKSGDLVSVNMTRKVHWAYRDKTKMPVKQYICPNPRYTENEVPESVTISGWTKQTACHRRFNWYLEPYFAHAHKNEIAVCTKVIYGHVSAEEILTWFEIHRRLGVNKVLSYTYNLNPDATKVLQYYESQGLLETFPFSLPKASRGRKVTQVGVKNFQAWNDEQIPVYDCFEKLKGYKYLAVIDIDEYLVPKTEKTWTELFEKLWKVRPYAAGYTFLVHLHITSWNVTNNSSHFTVGRYENRTAAMLDRMKHVTRPDRLDVGGLSTHMYTPLWEKKYRRFQAKESDATIHHFRSCRKDWAKKLANKTCMNLERFHDTSVADLLAPIEKDIVKLKSVILQDG